MHDVVIVGCGPAGATVARYLAKLGHDVLVFEKDVFPRDKPCGGGFSYNLIREFPYLRKRECEFLEGICRTGVLHSPNRMTILKGQVDMAVTLREVFDNVLYEEACDAGANVIQNTRVKEISFTQEFVSVMTNHGNETRARIIIGADGSNSIVARKTELNTRWASNSITACRVMEVPLNPEFIKETYGEELEYHFYANPFGLPGYGWLFPKRMTVNVGIGFVGTHAMGLPKLFDSFVRVVKKDSLLPDSITLMDVRGALVPTGGALEKTISDRCILIGDSAGMVNPMTGGGIAYAMQASKIAAKVLNDFIQEDRLSSKDLQKYERAWRNDFGYEFGPLVRIQKIFTSPIASTLFEIGQRDEKLQSMVSQAMAESSDDKLDKRGILLRTLYVCLREAFHL